MTQEDSPTGRERWERVRRRKTQERTGAEPRVVPRDGGYYWIPSQGRGALTWDVISCHELGLDAGIGHADFWPAVIDRLATTWDKDERALQRLLKDRYYGLPRGRVTRPGGRFLILHGADSPPSDWLEQVIRRFGLERRSVKVLFDEHETMMAEDQNRVMSALGISVGGQKVERSDG